MKLIISNIIMKRNNIKNIARTLLFCSLIVFLAGCERNTDWIDEGLNVDPDSPADVPMKLLLPAIQQEMGYNLVGNNTARTNNIWTQHFDGVSRQAYTEARYQLTPADVNNVWGSIYASMLINSQLIIEKSKTEGQESPHYAGVAQVLQATTLGITTDLFGDIPYSEALKGSENILRPIYDSQESIYNNIFALLDDALTNLNSPTNVLDVEGDVCFGGDIDNWIKAANSIKARHYLQLSNQLGNQAYTLALAALQNGFTSNADDFLVPFEDANRNPLFQFMEQRTDIRMASTFVDLLIASDDPRLPFYVAENGDGEFVGSVIGSQNESASWPGDYIAGPSASVPMMTYSELKFIEAEARFVLGQAGAQEAYEDAVAASVLRVTGEANTAWLDANINGDPVTLEKIIQQKYIDGVATNQPYADWRRTGLPVIALHPDAVISNIPTRFPYAQSEIDNNRENVPSVTISDKLWWDQ
ncbi:SusD/RagB family nutrient-binding outer membrane lipoprotein [Flagellimonas amoyensis]|uniref:SusD/RagB family nutrient-binding outer membrane lipoprotein n=1 Tax=Flagellimonas amoyensis TaxID=2169401 RepID=UPI000D34952C|nr:SusD/RagB family nutrient-binding outer membrane lipoprotein [Allomuricauda amoyensis]